MNTTQITDRIHQRRWWILAVLCTTLLLGSVDNTILNVALPSISSELGATGSQLQWIVDSYVLVFAGLLLAAGSLGDRFGRKGALVVGTAVFGAGSLLAPLASSAGQLIVCRAVMGLGAAFLLPSTLSILTNVFRDPRERGRAIAIWAGVFGLGIAIGPVAGGWLLEHFYWGSVFLVNAPVIVVALVATVLTVPSSKDPSAPRIDVPGIGLSIAGLTTLVWTIVDAPERGWTSPVILGSFTISAALIVAFVWWERRCRQPMLDVRFFADRRFSVASTSVALTYFALFGSMFLLTQYLQFVRGYDALDAGIRYLPLAVVLLVVAPLSAALVERLGTKVVVGAGMTLCAVGLLLTLRLETDSPYTAVLLALVTIAAGGGLTMAPATESIMGSLPPEKAGVGSAVNDATREVGGALGVAILGSLLASVYRDGLGDGATAAVPAEAAELARDSIGGAVAATSRLGEQGQGLLDAARNAFVDGMHLASTVGAAITFVAAAAVFAYLPARAHRRSSLDATHEFQPTTPITEGATP